MRFADHIAVANPDGMALRILPRPVASIVTVVGSFDTLPDHRRREDVLQDVVVELLDKGTVDRDRFEIARAIEDRGAEISFSSQALSVHFVAKCLSNHVEEIMQLAADQLREPAFHEDEFKKVKHQLASRIRRSLESTSAQAQAALTAELFAPGHPNHGYSPEEDLETVEKLTIDDVRRYHREHFTGSRLVACAVGDIAPADFERAAETAFAGFGREDPSEDEDPRPDTFDRLSLPKGEKRVEVPIPDKNNLDARLGVSVDLRKDHPDFEALHVGNYVLGGNFSARLMSRVREELGLTYGIRSSLSGFDRFFAGYWQIGVTLSRENLEAGLSATRETVDRFIAEGITADELTTKQRTLTGLFKVGLSTTRGLARTIHSHYRNGFEPSYIDEYPGLIDALTVDDVNRAIEKYFVGDAMVTAVAGTL